MRSACLALALLSMLAPTGAQHPAAKFSDPVALLHAVAKTYAEGADAFRIDSETETVSNDELHREWQRVYRSAIKGPEALYRIETRSHWGSYVQVSDGEQELVYQTESRVYVKRPLPENWPGFSRIANSGQMELKNAWEMRTFLEEEMGRYKRAEMLPEADLDLGGTHFLCYRVHTTSADMGDPRKTDYRFEKTIWIEEKTLAIRKIEEHASTVMIESPTVHIPFEQETTTTYPVVDFHPQAAAATFRFALPDGAREVASLDPDIKLPPLETPQMAGKPAPEFSYSATGGERVGLSDFRGKPVLIDFWATWCGACLVAMPSFNRVARDAQEKGLAVVSFDQDTVPEDAPAYLRRHGFDWRNFHDTEGKVRKAFVGSGIPLTVLIDAQGRIAYYGLGSDEAALRKAIAALGPEYASIGAGDGKAP